MNNWKRYFIEQLHQHPQKLMAQDNIRRRISDLSARMQSPKIANTGGVTTGGDVSRYEDSLLNAVYEKGSLEVQYRNNVQDIKQIEKALEVLNEEELWIIEGLYFNKISPDNLGNKLHMSRSTVYNHRDRAIEKMLMHLYGTK